MLASGSPTNPIDIDLDDVVVHLTKLKKLRVGSSALLSMDPTEWLNDCQVANLLALMTLAQKHQVKFKYPRDGNHVAALFDCKDLRRMLTGESPLAALSQDYASEAHWRTLKIVLCEKVVYYHEPFGSKLRANSPVVQAFERALGSLNDGWRFEPIELKFQTDGSSCGVWSPPLTD